MLAHVLAIDITNYSEVIANASTSILSECVCASCGGDSLELTNSWVVRGVQSGADSYSQMRIRLARCETCGGRERILPCDVLPGKVNSVGNVFGAVEEVVQQVPIAEVARRHDVSRACVRKWVYGAGARYLDLCDLVRHRAMVASPATRPEERLVRFFGFLSAAQTKRGVELVLPSPVIGTFPERQEIGTAVGSLLSSLSELGGALESCRQGAELFGQSVLLFRYLGVNTPSSIAISGSFGQDSQCEMPEENDGQTAARPQIDSAMALRSNRAPVARGSPGRRAGGVGSADEQGGGGVAFG